MRHLQRISVAKADLKDNGDVGAAIFFQLFFTVVALMFSAAFGK